MQLTTLKNVKNGSIVKTFIYQNLKIIWYLSLTLIFSTFLILYLANVYCFTMIQEFNSPNYHSDKTLHGLDFEILVYHNMYIRPF